jgi:hypothetical protein
MRHKDKPVRGEILFSGRVSAEIPYEASFRFTVYAQDGGECRVVYERERVFSAFRTTKDTCDQSLSAFSIITQSLDAAQDECEEHL